LSRQAQCEPKGKLRTKCPLLAQSGHLFLQCECPLLGVKRTLPTLLLVA
jgi:hypothetical protein